jgi:hypothetical protein
MSVVFQQTAQDLELSYFAKHQERQPMDVLAAAQFAAPKTTRSAKRELLQNPSHVGRADNETRPQNRDLGRE